MTDDILKGRTVALDFDGPVHSYVRGWTGVVPEDPPVPGAREFVAGLQARGARVVILSSRATSIAGIKAIHTWLLRYGFPALQVQAVKPAAIAYVDDRAVVWSVNRSWAEVAADIEALAVPTR